MVLPFVAVGVLKFCLVDFPATYVDDPVGTLVPLIQKFHHIVNGVSIELLEPRGGESHSDDSICDVSKIEIVPILPESVLRA